MDGVGSPPNRSSGSFFTPLMISMAGIGLTSLAVVAYHFFVVRYCLRRRLRSSMDSAASQPLSNPQFANGVEEKVLGTIPILSYSTRDHDNNFFRVDQTECVVCLGELEDGDMVRLLPNCRHAFHVPCVDNWFHGHSSCPICRSPVDESASVTPDVAFPVCDVHDTDEVAENLPDHHFPGQHGGSLINTSNASDYSSGVGSTCLLRHSVSSVMPMEGKPQLSIAALKRSRSMDQYYILVNLQNENKKEGSSSCSSSPSSNVLMESRSYRARSIKQLDRMSSRLMTSFSQLRMGRFSSTANEILPY